MVTTPPLRIENNFLAFEELNSQCAPLEFLPIPKQITIMEFGPRGT